MSSAKTQRHWQRWLHFVQDPRTQPDITLVGLPGHMHLPETWNARGRLPYEHLLYFITEGKLQFLIEGKTDTLSRGGLLWIRPGTTFSCTHGKRGKLSILRCRFRLQNPEKALNTPWSHRFWQEGNQCFPWLEWLVREADLPEKWHAIRLRSLLTGFFTELARIDTKDSGSRLELTHFQRQKLTQLVAERPDARATTRELASVTGLSYDYFSRCFRNTFKKNPRRWLVEQRLQLAKIRLSETDLRIGEIARELGYGDVFLFSRQFKKFTGTSPVEYRKRLPLY